MSDSNENLAFVNGGPLPHVERSMWDLIKKGCDENPEGPAVISVHQAPSHMASIIGKSATGNDDCLSWTHLEMKKGASYLMAGLEAKNVKRGSTLVTFLPNGIEWALFFWAAAMFQLTIVPLDADIIRPGREDQLRYFLDTLRPNVVVVSGIEESKTFDGVSGTQDHMVKVLCSTDNSRTPDAWLSFEDLAATGKAFGEVEKIIQDDALEADGNRRSSILFTSGTSIGRPKGCPHTSLSLCSTVVSPNRYFILEPLPRILVHTVNFRGICIFSALAAWRNAGCLVLAGRTFDPRVTLETAEKFKCCWMILVPSMLPALASQLSITSRDLSSVSFLSIGGDIATEQVIHTAQRLFPKANVKNIFGMTEGSGVFGWSLEEDRDYTPTFSSIAASGKVMPGAKVKICASGGRQILERGQIGDLHISYSGMVKYYHGGEEPELFYTESDGTDWIITGDQSVIDKDGCIFVLGRNKDVIKRNAVPLSPPVIEVFLKSQLDIVGQAFGIPAPHVGAEPYVVVADAGTHDLSTLPDLVASGLGHDYKLKEVATLGQLGFESWPMNASGKVVKNELREAMVQYIDSKSA